MLSPLVGAGVGCLVGVALTLIVSSLRLPSIIAMLAAPIASAILGSLLTWGLLPRIARKAAKAEWANGLLVLLYTRDDKVYPIAAKYVPSKDVIEPIDEARGRIVFFTEPGSTTSVHGHKLKVAFTYIDHPVTINPKYAAVVFDLRYKYGLEDLGVALDIEAATEGEEERLRSELEQMQELAKLAEAALRGNEEALQKVAKTVGAEPEEIDNHYLQELRDYAMKRAASLEYALSVKRRPIVYVGGRFWSPRDLLGFLGFRVRAVDLRMMRELARLEVLERTKSSLREWAPIIMVVLLGVIVLAAIALIFSFASGAVHVGQTATVTTSQTPAQLPKVVVNTSTTPAVVKP